MRKVILTLISTIFFAAHANADIAIVVHPDNPLSTATKEEVSKLFLAKTKMFANGKQINLVDLEEGDEIRDKFYQAVTDKTPSQVKAYWSRLIFTGKGQPPRVVLDSDEVVSAVAADANTIGYLDSDSVNSSVKVIFTIQ